MNIWEKIFRIKKKIEPGQVWRYKEFADKEIRVIKINDNTIYYQKLESSINQTHSAKKKDFLKTFKLKKQKNS